MMDPPTVEEQVISKVLARLAEHYELDLNNVDDRDQMAVILAKEFIDLCYAAFRIKSGD